VELSWSTFLFEIINFLVLIWILKRFLFNPVRTVIARRRAEIDKRIMDAEALHADAVILKQQYQERLSDWEAEKRQLHHSLTQELETEKAKRLAVIATQIEKERERDRVAAARQREDRRRLMEETAMRQGAAFASRLLQTSAGAETEMSLIDQVIMELEALPQARIESFQSVQGEQADIRILTAYSVTARQQQRLQAALARLFSAERPVLYEQDKTLLAGIRIATGNWVLGCNIKDELAGFTEFDHDE
jgi:F-type H+-transporting ATPase subunit b